MSRGDVASSHARLLRGLRSAHSKHPCQVPHVSQSMLRPQADTNCFPQPLLEVAVTEVSGGVVRKEHCPSDSLTYVPVTFKACE